MKPPENAAWRLSRDWLAKASTDLPVCERLLVEGAASSEAIAFHAQQMSRGFANVGSRIAWAR
jgi:hypothetical protein